MWELEKDFLSQALILAAWPVPRLQLLDITNTLVQSHPDILQLINVVLGC